ncbi:MFS transporter [Kitasatospora sp. NPDC093806]|uniref:MFS transporter n=1 Tax=Kitasatospora sp. NPDC093806 TaxID=3155075 RepID=UPI0034226009
MTHPDGPAAGTGLAALLRVRDARLYFGGLALSQFGDNVLLLAAGIWVKSLTGSDGAAGVIMFFVSAPALLSALFGLLADRVRKRALMITVNLVMAAATLALLTVDTAGDAWLVYTVMTAYGTALVIIGAAESGLFVSMLPERLLGAANTMVMSLQESMKVVAPAVGAALFAAFGGHALALLDVATFLLAAGALALLRVPEPAPRPGSKALRAELLTGVRHVSRTPGLRLVVFGCAAVMGVMGFTNTALFGLVDDGLHRAPVFLGLLMCVQGVGSVAGGLFAPRLMARIGEGRFVALGMAVSAAGNALLLVPAEAVVLPGMALRGIGLPWAVIGAYTLMQRRTPVELMGQAAGSINLIIFVPQAVSVLVGAGLGEVLGYRGLFAVTSVCVAAVCGFLLSRAEVRSAGAEPEPGTTEPTPSERSQ